MNKTILSLGLGMLTGSQNGAMAVHVVSPNPASFLQIQKKKGNSPQATVPFLDDFNQWAGKMYTIRWNANTVNEDGTTGSLSLENVITGEPTPVQPLDFSDMNKIARALTSSGIFDVNLVNEADYSIRFYFRNFNEIIMSGDAIISDREEPGAPERLNEDSDDFGLRADNESDDEDGVAPNALNLSSASGNSALDRAVIMLDAINNSFSDNSDIMNQSEDSVSFHLASPAASENMTLSQPAPNNLSQPAPIGLAQAMLRRTISENSSQSTTPLLHYGTPAVLHRSVSAAAEEEDDDLAAECGICFDLLATDDQPLKYCDNKTVGKNSKHCFHAKCLNRWINMKRTPAFVGEVTQPRCPICRTCFDGCPDSAGLLTRTTSTISGVSAISIQRTETTSSTSSNGSFLGADVLMAPLEYPDNTACPNASSVSLNVTDPQESEDGSESFTPVNAGAERW